MSSTAKNAILKAKIENVIYEIMVKTSAEQVDLNGVTVATKISEMITAINARAKKEDVTKEINSTVSTAISNLINGAPETYDTLKEIADYIASHEDVVTSLNAAIGNKADKSSLETLSETVAAIKTVTDGLGTIAKLNSIEESNLADALKTKIDNANTKAHEHSNKTVLDGITSTKVTEWDGAVSAKHSHSNKDVLDGITSTKVTEWDDAVSTKHSHNNKDVIDSISSENVIEWDSKARIYFSSTQPENLSENDLWFCIS